MEYNDFYRLEWLEKRQGFALISDDLGSWAIASDGLQSIPEDPPDDLMTAFLIEKHAWRPTIREAIDHAIDLEKKGA